MAGCIKPIGDIESDDLNPEPSRDTDRKIDIIVTDIIMPGQYSGIQLVEDLRKKMPAVKVLYISGYTADNVIADDENFLSKPFGVKELLGEVRKILEQN